MCKRLVEAGVQSACTAERLRCSSTGSTGASCTRLIGAPALWQAMECALSQQHWAAMSPYAKLSADDTDQICHPTEKEGCNRPELPLSPVGWLDLLISVYVCTLHSAFAHCSYLLASPLGMQHVLEAVGPAAVVFAFLAVHLCLRYLSHPCASLA